MFELRIHNIYIYILFLFYYYYILYILYYILYIVIITIIIIITIRYIYNSIYNKKIQEVVHLKPLGFHQPPCDCIGVFYHQLGIGPRELQEH